MSLDHAVLRKAMLGFGIAGALFFGIALIGSFIDPGLVERLARELIRYRVESQVRQQIDRLDESLLAAKAREHIRASEGTIELAKRLLREKLPERMAAVIGDMRNLDCECRRKIESRFRGWLQGTIANADTLTEKLDGLIRTKYMETAAKLTREFKIFTGANAIVFLFLTLAVVVRPRANVHLVPAAVLLLFSAILTGALYLFNQDWLHTLVFSDYPGWGYVAYMSAGFATLCDIVFNRGAVTSWILTTIAEAIGHAVSIVPC